MRRAVFSWGEPGGIIFNYPISIGTLFLLQYKNGPFHANPVWEYNYEWGILASNMLNDIPATPGDNYTILYSLQEKNLEWLALAILR